MKKIFLLLVVMSLTACTANKIDNVVSDNETNEDVSNGKVIDTYVDDNPIKVGLYQNGHLIKNYETKIGYYEDIASFDVYYTNKEVLDSTNTKHNFNKFYNEYENINNYKIGFYVAFEIDDKKVEQVILGPESLFSMSPYIYNYLYDDIHEPDGAWYSHVEEKDMNKDTIFSSIKLFAADEGNKISSPITLTVFTYDGDEDFDENGHYRGNSYYTLMIIPH